MNKALTVYGGPTSGAVFYYHASSGKSQWKRPTTTTISNFLASPLQEDWIEEFDGTTGGKYYYNSKTNASLWEQPASEHQSTSLCSDKNMTTNESEDGNYRDHPSNFPRCLGCGGWGMGLVQSCSYCCHCTRNLAENKLHASFPYILEILKHLHHLNLSHNLLLGPGVMGINQATRLCITEHLCGLFMRML